MKLEDNEEVALVEMVSCWAQYAVATVESRGSRLGNDNILGPAWKNIGHGFLVLLNGPAGDLDRGSLDAFIRNNLVEQGFPDDM